MSLGNETSVLVIMVGSDNGANKSAVAGGANANGSAAEAPAVPVSREQAEQASSKVLLDKLLPDGHTPGVVGDADFDMTSSDYYFNSYAHFGIHEEVRVAGLSFLFLQICATPWPAGL